jgi:hypothetical protein
MSCKYNTGGCQVDTLDTCEFSDICKAAEEQRPRWKLDPDKLVKVAFWVTVIVVIAIFSYLAFLGYLEIRYQDAIDNKPIW